MVTGGCQCGAVRYEISGDTPDQIFVCHCRECQKQSASAFGMSALVDRSALRVTQGEIRRWQRTADSGNAIDCTFCPTCGSRLWHVSEQAPDTLRMRGGSLDTPPDIGAAVHIWTKRKLAGVVLPAGVRQFPGQPK